MVVVVVGGTDLPLPLLTIQTLDETMDLHRFDLCQYVAKYFVKTEE